MQIQCSKGGVGQACNHSLRVLIICCACKAAALHAQAMSARAHACLDVA